MSRKLVIVQGKETPSHLHPITDVERRQYQRHAPQKDQTEALFSYRGNKYTACILDVSLGGYKITTEAPLVVGEVLAFHLPIVRKGRVVWSQMVFWGIQFID